VSEREKERGRKGGREGGAEGGGDLKMKFVLDMLRVATTMTKGKAEITLRRRRTVSIWEMVRWWR
jgi:hypothetical protein